MYLLNFWKISLLKIQKLLPALFSRNFLLNSIYLELLIIGGSIFTLYLWLFCSCSYFTLYLWWVFSLFCILFLFPFFLLFLFISIFSLTDTNDSHDSREGRGNHCFSCFFTSTASRTLICSSRFLTLLFNRCIFNYQTDSWWGLFSVEICILFAFSLMQSSRSYWLWHFKVTSCG